MEGTRAGQGRADAMESPGNAPTPHLSALEGQEWKIQGSGRRGKRKARPEASTSLSWAEKIRKRTLDGGRRTGKKVSELKPSESFSQAVSHSIKGEAWTLGRQNGNGAVGSDPTAYISLPKGKSKRKGSVSRVKREESDSKAFRSSSSSFGTRLQKENYSRRKSATSPRHQLPHKRLQRDADFEVKTETRLESETQLSHFYLQSPSQSNSFSHLQPQNPSPNGISPSPIPRSNPSRQVPRIVKLSHVRRMESMPGGEWQAGEEEEIQ